MNSKQRHWADLNELATPRRRDGGGLARRLSGPLLAALALAGCGAPTEDVDPELSTTTADLSSAGWRSWTSPPPNPNPLTDSPGICPVHVRSGHGASGVMFLARDSTTDKFRLTIYDKLKPWLAWTNVPGTPVFNSRPACTSLDELHLAPTSQWNNQIAIVGRRESSSSSLDNRYYVQIMRLNTVSYDPDNNPATPPPPPPAPSTVLSWSRISTDAYAGSPASAVLAGNLVVAGRRSDNRIYVHVNPLNTSSTTAPYDHADWEPAVRTAALPSGWTAIGNPAIGHIGQAIGEGIIATRARNAQGDVRIYTYYMYVPWRMVSAFALDQGTWQHMPTQYVGVGSDVALEFETLMDGPARTTAYFRGTNNRIYQATGDGSNWEAFTLVDNISDPNDNYADFENAPAALGSSELEGGHIVLAKRADDQLYYASPIPGFGYP